MHRSITLYLLGLLCLLPLAELAAQHTDTVPPARRDTFFNALDYSMQKRFRERKYAFANKSFMDNTYVSLQIGMEDYINRPGSDMGVGKDVSVSFGKLFTGEHSLRATLGYGWAYAGTTDDKFQRMGLRISYLFNTTSYLRGYDPYRILEISPLAGLGYSRTSGGDDGGSGVLELHLGAQAKVHLFPKLDVYAEPTLTFYSDGVDHYTRTNWHKYDVGYGVRVGFIYRLADPLDGQPKHGRHAEAPFANTFVSLAGGAHFQNTDRVREAGISAMMGPHAAASAGKWLTPHVAVRFSGFYASNFWYQRNLRSADGTVVQTENLTCSYMGVRTEAMVNTFSYIKGRAWAERLALSVLAGVEVGAINKQDVSQTIKQVYYGLTGGLQLKYNIARRWGVFLEPRISIVPYSYQPKDPEGKIQVDRSNYFDNCISMNLGVEFKL